MRSKKKLNLAVLFPIAAVLACLYTPRQSLAQAPSFDCSKAGTRMEELICSDKNLSELDSELAETYRTLRDRLPESERKKLQREQVAWRKQRDLECVGESDERSLYLLGESYETRIWELQNWGQCWRRRKAPYVIPDGSICRAFAQVLETTCETPDNLRCNWTLPPGEKKFKKLKWEPLEWREYWDLIKDLRLSGLREDLREDTWKKDEARIRKMWEEGKRSLSTTRVDIDHDGQVELVVRYDLVPCHEEPGTMFGVVNPETKRLDWRFRNLFLSANASEGAEIMIYDGRAFMFGLERGWRTGMIWEGFRDEERGGRLNICIFEYQKEGENP